jgi:hypothetical protein
MAVDVAEPELCIDCIRRVVREMRPYRLIARGRKAPRAACTMRSSAVQDRRQRHGGIVGDFLVGISVLTFGVPGYKSQKR